MPKSESTARVNYLDGIRGWASIAVLMQHVICNFLASKYTILKSRYLAFATDGEFAVYVFFVLSGMALSINYVRNRDHRELTKLAIRRYPRLTIPIFASSLIAFVLFRFHYFYNIDAAAILKNEWWLGTFYVKVPTITEFLWFNLLGVYSGEPSFNFNLNLWTMPYEFTGSVFVFLVCAFVVSSRRFMYIFIPLALSSLYAGLLFPFLCGIVLSMTLEKVSEYSSQTRRRELLANIVSVAALLFCLVYVILSRRVPFDTPVIARTPINLSLVATLFIAAVAVNRPLRAFFSNALSSYLGSISFSLYLTHLITICSIASFLAIGMAAHDGFSPCLILILATTISCIAVAHCFRPVETFSIRASRRFSEFIV